MRKPLVSSRWVRVLARASANALYQVEELVRSIPELNFTILPLQNLIEVENRQVGSTLGDCAARDLHEALLAGEGDVAIHSAEDLPFPLLGGLCVVALNHRFDVESGGTSAPHQPKSGNRVSEILDRPAHPLREMLAIVAKKDRADMKKCFHSFDERKRYGRVSLVGAGCGDPELLTIKADRALHMAEVIFHDDLLDASALERYSGEKIYVGKRGGSHSSSQDEINERMYRTALSGRNSVRLKGGDPFVFGRGGEEVRYLAERFVETEVIPGITSALGAAASLSLPLSYRGIARDMAFITAHRKDGDIRVGDSETLVYYMAAGLLPELKRRLLDAGKPPDTPVVLVQNATLPEERSQYVTIAEMERPGFGSPLLVLVGESLAFAVQQDRYLFVGSGPSAASVKVPGKLVPLPLEENVFSLPSTLNIDLYDALLFASEVGVESFARYFEFGSLPVYAIGEAVRRAVLSRTSRPATVCTALGFDSVARQIGLHHVLYPCSSLSRNHLCELENVDPIVFWEPSRRERDELDLSTFSGAVFCSPTTVNAFWERYGEFPRSWVYYTFGAATTGELLDFQVSQESIITLGK